MHNGYVIRPTTTQKISEHHNAYAMNRTQYTKNPRSEYRYSRREFENTELFQLDNVSVVNGEKRTPAFIGGPGTSGTSTHHVYVLQLVLC